MNVYLDTSTVLRVLLRQPKPLAVWAGWERAYASELLHVEACRVIDRLRLEGILDDDGVADAHEELVRIESVIANIPPATDDVLLLIERLTVVAVKAYCASRTRPRPESFGGWRSRRDPYSSSPRRRRTGRVSAG